MKMHIDFSVMTHETAIGNVTGVLELVAVPPPGATIVLSRPPKPVPLAMVDGFTGHLKVEHVLFLPYSGEVEIMLSLEDVVVRSRDDALEVFKYFEEGFGWWGQEYD